MSIGIKEDWDVEKALLWRKRCKPEEIVLTLRQVDDWFRRVSRLADALAGSARAWSRAAGGGRLARYEDVHDAE